ncbi:hypothetical protein DTO280E4_9144 [Paecilomyces variotii]|nr:hypothetical protein DTO021C3_8952 [Paecilomyces variotii]KAJ9349143.1 hypothetical protein DTO280E4_9144 [Paecilomyces variotii]
MTAVIKGFRDGTIATVKWPNLIETAFELDRASDELLWYIHIVEQLDIYNSNPEVRHIAQSQATQNVRIAKGHIDSARDQVQSWLLERE